MSNDTPATIKSLTSLAMEEAVRTFKNGISNSFIRSTLYGNPIRDLEHAYAVAQMIEHDDNYGKLELSYTRTDSQTQPQQRVKRYPHHNHQQQNARRPSYNYQQHHQYNNWHPPRREQNQQPEPMDTSSGHTAFRQQTPMRPQQHYSSPPWKRSRETSGTFYHSNKIQRNNNSTLTADPRRTESEITNITQGRRSCKKTAFSFNGGKYEFNRMPFGLKNAPAIFQRCVDYILRPYIGKFAYVYIDDVLIFSSTPEEHMKHIDVIFKTLKENTLKVSSEKSKFFMPEVEYLGHIISHNKIHPNPEKVSVIKDYPVPTNLKSLRGFLGIASYYRKFIEGYAKIAKPLTNYLQGNNSKVNKNQSKNQKITLDQLALEAFNKLKNALATQTTLYQPDQTKPFEICTDASNYAIGAVLQQGGKPIHFISRNLSKTEQNYSTNERELLAIIWALHKLRNYIYGVNDLTIVTDHQSLIYSIAERNPNPKLKRWKMIIEDYGAKIIYKPGKTNIVADALSRFSTNTSTLSTVHSSDESPTDDIKITARPLNTYSQQVEVIKVLQELDNKPEAAERLEEIITAHFPECKRLVTDNEACFTATTIDQLCKRHNIRKIETPIYHSTSNGQVERVNNTITELTRVLKIHNNSSVHEEIFKAVKELNNSIHSVTGHRPRDIYFNTQGYDKEKIINKLKKASENVLKRLNKGAENKIYHPGEQILILRKGTKKKSDVHYRKATVKQDLGDKIETQRGAIVHKDSIKNIVINNETNLPNPYKQIVSHNFLPTTEELIWIKKIEILADQLDEHRAKRSINFLGSYLKFITGTPDRDETIQIESAINTLINNNEKQKVINSRLERIMDSLSTTHLKNHLFIKEVLDQLLLIVRTINAAKHNEYLAEALNMDDLKEKLRHINLGCWVYFLVKLSMKPKPKPVPDQARNVLPALSFIPNGPSNHKTGFVC
ncbi:Retrovirus-related Pol polyprotein from transposon gypsy [Eumeta japonica]|uniref:RNA-directed DNA polymerase n=1 Tax=Eumeta variegata TaxID=151549 RepID=A0A4C1T8Y2_EUMVA|nr:Retrovirus-related Pol polyprotein from transposon gypsy [Eumeta japonica]